MQTLINGLVSVRALKKVEYMRDDLVDEVDLSANVTFMYVTLHRWLGVRLDSAALIFVLSVGIFSLLFKNQLDASDLAFSLQIVLDLVFFLSISLRFCGEFENYTTSA